MQLNAEYFAAIDRLFGAGGAATTAEVAEVANISRATALYAAADIGVRRIGSGYAWSEDNFSKLWSELSGDDDPEEE